MNKQTGTFGHTKWASPVLVEGTGVPPRGEQLVDSNRKLVEAVDGRRQWYTQKYPIAADVTYKYEASLSGAFELQETYPGDNYYAKLTADDYKPLELSIDVIEGSESVVIWSILPIDTSYNSSGDYSGSLSGAHNGADSIALLDGNGDLCYLAHIGKEEYEIPDVELGHYILRAKNNSITQVSLIEVTGGMSSDIGAWPVGNSSIRGVVVDAVTGEGVNVELELIRNLSQRPSVRVDDVTVYDGDTQVEVESIDAESGLVILKSAPSEIPTIIYHYLSGDTFASNDMVVS